MPLYEPTLPYRYVAPLIDILREQDSEVVSEALLQAGLEAAEWEHADSSIPMAEFDALLAFASAELHRDDLGFEMGKRITLETHSPLRQAIGSCKTLQDIMLLLERYYHLVTPVFTVRYLPGDSHCEWRIRAAAPMSQATLYMCLEMHAVSVHVDLTKMFGMDAVFDIYLSAPPPAHRARYNRLPYTRFHFGEGTLPEVRCVIPTDLIRRNLRKKRNTPDGWIEALRAHSPSELRIADRYSDWVELMLHEAQFVQPTVRQLSGLLNISSRTLARRLATEGINFRQLSTHIRHKRACAMLAESSNSLHQIASQLGYSDRTAFLRSFRRTIGITPAQYRGKCQQEQGHN